MLKNDFFSLCQSQGEHLYSSFFAELGGLGKQLFFLLSRKHRLQLKDGFSPHIKFAKKSQGSVWLKEEPGFLCVAWYNGLGLIPSGTLAHLVKGLDKVALPRLPASRGRRPQLRVNM